LYKAPRGTSDILPGEQNYWRHITEQATAICQCYGYQRIDTPAFEDSRLFVRSIGEETDIVDKEMYTLEDRSGDSLTLRPEGTASVCRSYIEHGMHNLLQPVRLFYFADIFRYERPQAGRFRQHHQFGVEALGDGDPALDAEVIEIAWRFYAGLGLHELMLNLNSIGCCDCRKIYLDSLTGYYSKQVGSLCPDCTRRLSTNPLRLLDCKKPSCVPLTEQSPRSTDYLCEECSEHFDKLKKYLTLLDIPFLVNHRLVRGLDYYTKTVFEITPQGELAAQATIGGGGRYDNLMEQLGGKPTHAVGFATGIERIVLNLKKQNISVPNIPAPAVFIAYLGQEAKCEAVKLASRLRNAGVSATSSFSDRSLKSQLKQADSKGACTAVIIGGDEVKNRTVILRNMNTGDQQTVPWEEAVEALNRAVSLFFSL